MDDFLTKPVRPADLWAAIERVLKTRSARRPADLDLLDVPVLLAACGGDAALLREDVPFAQIAGATSTWR